jgi:TPR repeat protein
MGHAKSNVECRCLARKRNCDEEAFRYFRRAAELGDSLGQYKWAQRYEPGSGVKTNREMALKVHKMWIKQNDPRRIFCTFFVSAILCAKHWW